jgi:hypothetical protein
VQPPAPPHTHPPNLAIPHSTFHIPYSIRLTLDGPVESTFTERSLRQQITFLCRLLAYLIIAGDWAIGGLEFPYDCLTFVKYARREFAADF